MARVKMVLDKAGMTADARRFATPEVRETARQVLNVSTVNAPVRTGRLRASGRTKTKVAARTVAAVVEYPVNYAAAVHDGTPTHVIRARKKKALRFKVGGDTVIVKSVVHPGTKGDPFLTDAARYVAAARGHKFRRKRGM